MGEGPQGLGEVWLPGGQVEGFTRPGLKIRGEHLAGEIRSGGELVEVRRAQRRPPVGTEDSGYPTAESLSEQRFIVDGARVGHTDSEGVFWQLPESEYTDYADMEEEQRAAALRVRDGGACECPYCAARS